MELNEFSAFIIECLEDTSLYFIENKKCGYNFAPSAKMYKDIFISYILDPDFDWKGYDVLKNFIVKNSYVKFIESYDQIILPALIQSMILISTPEWTYQKYDYNEEIPIFNSIDEYEKYYYNLSSRIELIWGLL